MSTIQFIGNVVLVMAAIPANLFVLFFLKNRWTESQMGRQSMALAVVIALVLNLSVLRQFIGDSPVYAALRLGALSLIVPTLWWRLRLLLASQRETRRHDTLG